MTTAASARQPFPFIVGVPRSGTTLLRLMLNAHAELAVPPESYFITQVWRRRERYVGPSGVDLGVIVRDLLEDHTLNESFRRDWGLDPAVVRERLSGTTPDLASAMRAIFATYAETNGKPRYGDKTPEYIMEMPLLASLFPEARFVHLIRDGRAVALSLIEQPWGPKTVADAAELWSVRMRAAARDGRALGTQRYREFRYEQLIGDPEAVLRQICDFVGLDYDERMLSYRDTASRFIPARLLDHDRKLLDEVRGDLRDWRREMSRADVGAFEAIGGRQLSRLGYERAVRLPPVGVWLRVRGRRYLQAVAGRPQT